jgi:hypothetical protein
MIKDHAGSQTHRHGLSKISFIRLHLLISRLTHVVLVGALMVGPSLVGTAGAGHMTFPFPMYDI